MCPDSKIKYMANFLLISSKVTDLEMYTVIQKSLENHAIFGL